MNEKKQSIDDQIKQAELERLHSEINKNKAEEALARKQANEVWYSGRSLRLIIGGIITAATLGGIFYTAVILPLINLDKEIAKREAELADKKSQLAQTQIDSLNREKVKITATIDSLNNRSIIAGAFTNDVPDSIYANILEKLKMIKANDYFDRRFNPKGAGIENKFELQLGDSVVYDAATGLYWQRSGSQYHLTYADAQKYVEQLNADGYSGYSDWRLPTLKEAMSLMEPTRKEAISLMEPTKKGDLYIDPVFDAMQFWIWTADNFPSGDWWRVNFMKGVCSEFIVYDSYSVRAVRP